MKKTGLFILESKDFQVSIALDGKKAIEKALYDAPDAEEHRFTRGVP